LIAGLIEKFWQGKIEATALSDNAFHPEFAAVLLDDAFRDG